MKFYRKAPTFYNWSHDTKKGRIKKEDIADYVVSIGKKVNKSLLMAMSWNRLVFIFHNLNRKEAMGVSL